MTLEEYEKILEEKKKALQATKVEERKVDTKVFESMQQLSSKKTNNEEIFIKLVRIWIILFFVGCFDNNRARLIPVSLWFQGSDKDKRKDAAEKEEKAKKVCFSPFSRSNMQAFGFKHLRTEFYALFCVWF